MPQKMPITKIATLYANKNGNRLISVTSVNERLINEFSTHPPRQNADLSDHDSEILAYGVGFAMR